MELKIYCVKDTKVGFMSPFTMNNDELCLREARVAVNDSRPNVVNTNLEDKEIWCLGEFDDTTGVIKGVTPRLVATCISLKIVEEK